MKLGEALKQRVPRVRLSKWANPNTYLRLPLLADGKTGPWAELYDEILQRGVLGIRPGSQRLLIVDACEESDYEVYTGPVSVYEQDDSAFAKVYLES